MIVTIETMTPILLLLLQITFSLSGSRAMDCMYNICEQYKDYPEQKIMSILKKHPTMHSYFGGTIIKNSEDVGILARTHQQEPPEPFCKTRDMTKAPKMMKDVDGVERMMPQAGKFSLLLNFQECRRPGGSCYGGSIHGKGTQCVQKFIIVKLLTVNVGDDTMPYHRFKVPSTCVCVYHRFY